MKIGISSINFWYTKDIDERFARMRELGFDSVDEDLCETEYHYYQSYDAMREHCTAVRAAADKYGIEVFQIHASYGVWYKKDTMEESIDGVVDILKMALYGAHILGAKCCVIHPIHCFGYWHIGEYLSDEDVTKYTVDIMKRLIPVCEEYGVILCLENVPMQELTISKVEEVCRTVREIDSPWIGICLDTGHSAILGDDLGEAVRKCGKYLRCLHMHDNNGQGDIHILPYGGVINWNNFTDALAEIGYDGVMNLEVDLCRSGLMPREIIESTDRLAVKTIRYLADEVERKRGN